MKVVVQIIESERGWGQQVSYIETYKTLRGAEAFVKRFNARNNLPQTPDWYQYARIHSINEREVK